MPAKPKTIDDYLAPLPAAQQRALATLRATIRAAAPEAEECISYGLAAFKQNGMLVGMGATNNHCAFYLMSSSILDSFRDEIAKYDLSKGTIRFAADKPLPAGLVKKLDLQEMLQTLKALDALVKQQGFIEENVNLKSV